MKWIIFFVLMTLFGCSIDSRKNEEKSINDIEQGLDKRDSSKLNSGSKNSNSKIDKLEARLVIKSKNGDLLVCANDFNRDIKVELKYATKDNFMKRILYDTLKVAYLQEVVARRLAKCQEELTKINSNYHLLVYDALRPLSVQWEMWNALDSIPAAERGKFVSNPKNGSVHNYGAAVDITICDATGKPLDMGAKYDEIEKIAYPSLEQQFLKSGQLSQRQIDNRKLLRKVMQSQGFRNIPSEWWHFNAFSRNDCKLRFHIIEAEIDF